jgi:hypothetical protein
VVHKAIIRTRLICKTLVLSGESGQLLGQALCNGLDGVRAWIASYILFHGRSSEDKTLPIGR